MAAAIEMIRDRPMNGAERRKINRILARAIGLGILRDGGKLSKIDEDLLPTERVIQRWAAGSGNGTPGEEWDDSRKSTLPPLDDATHVVVDLIYMHAKISKPRYHTVIREWYCGTGSVVQVAKMLGVSRDGLYLEWRCALQYFRGEFARSGHPDLLSLIERLD